MRMPISICCEAPIDKDGFCLLCGLDQHENDLCEPLSDDIQETAYDGDGI